MNIVLHDLDFHFQGQTFSCYAFSVKNCTGNGCLRRVALVSFVARRNLHIDMCGISWVIHSYSDYNLLNLFSIKCCRHVAAACSMLLLYLVWQAYLCMSNIVVYVLY